MIPMSMSAAQISLLSLTSTELTAGRGLHLEVPKVLCAGQVEVGTKAEGEYTGRLGGRRNFRGVVKSVTQELGCLSLNAGSTTY